MNKTNVSNQALADQCLELSLLLRAGVSTGDALALMAEEGEVSEELARRVDDGEPLSAVLREEARFPDYACGLVEIGERTGRVEEALLALSRYYEDRMHLIRRVRSALLYPAVMLALMLAVIGVLLVSVLPVFEDVYASLGGRLTGVAGGLLTVGQWLKGAMPVLWVILALLAALAAAFALSESVRKKLLSGWQAKYGDKGIARKINDGRIAQAMSMGMSSGLTAEETVALAAGLSQGGAQKRCLDCRDRLERGETLSEALKASALLPAGQCRLLEVGQRGGAGDTMMEKIARDLSAEGAEALEDLVGRVEPALVLVCSLLVGLILLSVMLPLMNIMAALG